MGAHFGGRGVTPEMAQSMSDAIQSHVDQFGKAKQALKDGNYSEAFGHLLATGIPFVGPAAAHAAERMGGDAPEFDRYGNVVKSGHAPDVAGGVGEGAALLGEAVAPAAVEAARAPAAALRRGAGTFRESLASAPVSRPLAAIGTAAGGTAGYAVGGPVGAAAGGAAGAAIGSKLPAIPGAIADAVESARTGYQMQTNPPRPAPAWRGIPDPVAVEVPSVEPIPATALPSGRVPGHLRQAQTAPMPPPEVAPAAAPVPIAAPPAAEPLAPVEAPPTVKPKLSAAEVTRANQEAKAQRWAAALDKHGVDPEAVMQIPVERYTTAQIEQGATPGLHNVLDRLVDLGELPSGETIPNTSRPLIVKAMKRLRAQRIAQQLADEMRKSGTVQDVMGVNGSGTIGDLMKRPEEK